LGSHSHGPNPSSFDIESATNSHYDLLGSYLGRYGTIQLNPHYVILMWQNQNEYWLDLIYFFLHSTEKAKEAIFYSYNKNINGFAAILDEDEAAKIASM